MFKYRSSARYVLLLFISLIVVSLSASGKQQHIADFKQGDMDGWKEKKFSGKTNYKLVKQSDSWALKADSNASASGLFKELTIDLTKTPYLNWTWKVENTLGNTDEKTKKGDDYPARVYVVFSGGLLFWKTRALNYVWSSNQAVNSTWPNAYTGNARMIAVQSGKAMTGQWVTQKRNIREDFKAQFGQDVSQADAIAIMTDTDNTGLTATAYYGDIYFTKD